MTLHSIHVAESYWDAESFDFRCWEDNHACEPGPDGKWFCTSEKRHEIVDRLHVLLVELHIPTGTWKLVD